MTIEDVKLEPTADEIERVRRIIAKGWGEGRKWDDIALAAILAMDRRAEPELRSSEDYHADPVEQLAFELAAELEEAELRPNDYVTVNRDKLRQIAQRVLDRRAEVVGEPDAWQVKIRGRWCNLPEDWSRKDCSPDTEYRALYASPPAPAVAVPEDGA
jgi:hypothetical protein